MVGRGDVERVYNVRMKDTGWTNSKHCMPCVRPGEKMYTDGGTSSQATGIGRGRHVQAEQGVGGAEGAGYGSEWAKVEESDGWVRPDEVSRGTSSEVAK